jgi:hypothetical protein
MLSRIYLGFVILAVLPAWSQVAPSATGSESTPDDSMQMMIPPPVSDQSYPTDVGAETESNYLRGQVTFDTSYIDNLYAGSGASVSETIYTILPTISIDRHIPREHLLLTYSPGFTFYDPSSVLNEVDQGVNAVYQYRLTPHVNLSAQDEFQRSSTAYGLEDSINGGAVSGSSPILTPGIIAPFTKRMTNNAGAELSYQFSPVGMIGASGSLMELDYPNSTESLGLYSSDERGGGGFYNRRFSAAQYIGVNYQYAWVEATPQGTQSVTQTQTIDGFYSVYPRHDFSISVSGGPQHYTITQSSLPASSSWGPSVTVSLGWQGVHANVAVNYSKTVTSGGGFVGAFDSESGSASMRWQLSRSWTAAASGNYADNKSVTPLLFVSIPGGHSISGQATMGYAINKQLNLNFEYDRVHQVYGDVTAISNNPNSDREMISLVWQFMRPLGR